MLNRKLTIKEQNEILNTRFGIQVLDDGVILDSEGQEFFGFEKNLEHDLSTLNGIFNYQSEESFESGISQHKRDLRKLLGI